MGHDAFEVTISDPVLVFGAFRSFRMLSAAWNARAAMVSVGLPVATVGNTPLPTMYRLL